MKTYINLKTKEKTQISTVAFLWYKQGANVGIYVDGKRVNTWIQYGRKG
jgi:hypothetical protein